MNALKCLLVASAVLLFWPTINARPIEDQVDLQFNRLEAKYQGNKIMLLTLAKLRRDWRDYQSTQCFFEKTVAAGGQVAKGSSAAVGKVHEACLARTEAEMKASLQSF